MSVCATNTVIFDARHRVSLSCRKVVDNVRWAMINRTTFEDILNAILVQSTSQLSPSPALTFSPSHRSAHGQEVMPKFPRPPIVDGREGVHSNDPNDTENFAIISDLLSASVNASGTGYDHRTLENRCSAERNSNSQSISSSDHESLNCQDSVQANSFFGQNHSRGITNVSPTSMSNQASISTVSFVPTSLCRVDDDGLETIGIFIVCPVPLYIRSRNAIGCLSEFSGASSGECPESSNRRANEIRSAICPTDVATSSPNETEAVNISSRVQSSESVLIEGGPLSEIYCGRLKEQDSEREDLSETKRKSFEGISKVALACQNVYKTPFCVRNFASLSRKFLISDDTKRKIERRRTEETPSAKFFAQLSKRPYYKTNKQDVTLSIEFTSSDMKPSAYSSTSKGSRLTKLNGNLSQLPILRNQIDTASTAAKVIPIGGTVDGHVQESWSRWMAVDKDVLFYIIEHVLSSESIGVNEKVCSFSHSETTPSFSFATNKSFVERPVYLEAMPTSNTKWNCVDTSRVAAVIRSSPVNRQKPEDDNIYSLRESEKQDLYCVDSNSTKTKLSGFGIFTAKEIVDAFISIEKNEVNLNSETSVHLSTPRPFCDKSNSKTTSEELTKTVSKSNTFNLLSIDKSRFNEKEWCNGNHFAETNRKRKCSELHTSDFSDTRTLNGSSGLDAIETGNRDIAKNSRLGKSSGTFKWKSKMMMRLKVEGRLHRALSFTDKLIK